MSFYGLSDIFFPHLGISIHNLPMGISIFGFEIAFYGIIIAIAMLAGYFTAERQARKFGQNVDTLMDFAIIVIILGVIGARLYYVIFHWSSFKGDFWSIFNLRTGGLAIYGGVIVSIITAFVFCKIKKLEIGNFCDVCVPGLVLGQAIGRWANFFNREAFGKFTDSLFAMQMNRNAVGGDYLSSEAVLRARYATRPDALNKILEQIDKSVTIGGAEYIQAHPTFLYESVWNLGIFAFLLIYAKRKKFGGELLAWYVALYGIGRFWIEALRTDQLFFFGTKIPVSQIVAVVMLLGGAGVIIYNYIQLGKKDEDKRPNRIKEMKEAAKKDNKPESKVKIVK